MRIATLNVQNMRLNRAGGAAHLHGAWDSDDPQTEALDPIDRRLTARLVRDLAADVVVLQEVFDQATLDHFHAAFLLPAGVPPYPYRLCLPGNDGRGLDVAVLSRVVPDAVHSHAALTPGALGLAAPEGVSPDLPVFRRDCLMVDLGALTLFACHFKSAYPDPARSWAIRRLEATATRRIIERRFAATPEALWLVMGDLNEPDDSPGGVDVPGGRAIAPLEAADFAVDLMRRLPDAERWTYFDHHSGRRHCPDAVLASPALARRWPGARPVILRQGLGREADGASGLPHYPEVGGDRPHASDHAAVAIDLPGLSGA